MCRGICVFVLLLALLLLVPPLTTQSQQETGLVYCGREVLDKGDPPYREVYKDEIGQLYVLDKGGAYTLMDNGEVADVLSPSLFSLEILDDGSTRVLWSDEIGRLYYVDEMGNRIYPADEQVAVVSSGPLHEVLDDGSIRELFKDEVGQLYYLNERGEPVYQ